MLNSRIIDENVDSSPHAHSLLHDLRAVDDGVVVGNSIAGS